MTETDLDAVAENLRAVLHALDAGDLVAGASARSFVAGALAAVVALRDGTEVAVPELNHPSPGQ